MKDENRTQENTQFNQGGQNDRFGRIREEIAEMKKQIEAIGKQQEWIRKEIEKLNTYMDIVRLDLGHNLN